MIYLQDLFFKGWPFFLNKKNMSYKFWETVISDYEKLLENNILNYKTES